MHLWQKSFFSFRTIVHNQFCAEFFSTVWKFGDFSVTQIKICCFSNIKGYGFWLRKFSLISIYVKSKQQINLQFPHCALCVMCIDLFLQSKLFLWWYLAMLLESQTTFLLEIVKMGKRNYWVTLKTNSSIHLVCCQKKNYRGYFFPLTLPFLWE